MNVYQDTIADKHNSKKRIDQLSALYDISKAVNSIIDRDYLLMFILQKTKELLGVEGASIIFWDEQDGNFYFPVVAEDTKEMENRLKQLRFPCDSGIAGHVFREGKPALVQDVKKDKRFYQEIDQNISYQTRSILCVPLQGANKIFGVLEAVNKKQGGFTEDDLQLFSAMADNISIAVEKANLYFELQKAEAFLRRQNAELKLSIKQKYSFENIIGKCDRFINVIKRAEQVALTDATVLIYGETGTGKELIAQAIHNNSPRVTKNFIAINCGAIPENLLESELFGHEKGAYTHAVNRRIGRFEEANGGTIFLDEIGDMPFNLQVKLLRVLQEGIIHRLGSNQEFPIDIRLITATHQDLPKLVREEKFRQDLYYRLKVFELEIPPLRERKEDLPLLIERFIKCYNTKHGKKVTGLEERAHCALCSYNFPGNVRELEHIIERAVILAKGNLIGINDLPPEVANIKIKVAMPKELEDTFTIPTNNDELKEAKSLAKQKAEEKVERLFLDEMLTRAHGNVSEAARLAKMNRSWLAQMVCKYKLDLGKYRRGTD